MLVFWVITPYGLAGRYQRFGATEQQVCEIWGSHGGEDLDVVILGCDAVFPSSGLKMDTVCSSETLVSTYDSTRCYSPEDRRRRLHLRISDHSYLLFCWVPYQGKDVKWGCSGKGCWGECLDLRQRKERKKLHNEELHNLYRWLWLYALSLSAFSHNIIMRSFSILSYRSYRAGPLSCARSFTDSPHHFDSMDYRLRPVLVNHSENTRIFIRFPFYAFSIYAAIRRDATPRITTVTCTLHQLLLEW
jgi:hypothetical protein